MLIQTPCLRHQLSSHQYLVLLKLIQLLSLNLAHVVQQLSKEIMCLSASEVCLNFTSLVKEIFSHFGQKCKYSEDEPTVQLRKIFHQMEEKQTEREALIRERELELETNAREREDRREERMLMMLSAIIQSQQGMMPFSGALQTHILFLLPLQHTYHKVNKFLHVMSNHNTIVFITCIELNKL